MRRNSLLMLMSMIVLLIVIGVLLSYISLRSATSDTVATGTVIPATLPAPAGQPIALSSESVGMPMRLVYIVSILVVFVSAVLIVFGMLLKTLIKDRQ